MAEHLLPIDVEVVGGPVPPTDQAYAWEELGDLRRESPRPMRHGLAHLCAGVDVNGRSIAAVDAFLVLDPDLVIVDTEPSPKPSTPWTSLITHRHRIYCPGPRNIPQTRASGSQVRRW